MARVHAGDVDLVRHLHPSVEDRQPGKPGSRDVGLRGRWATTRPRFMVSISLGGREGRCKVKRQVLAVSVADDCSSWPGSARVTSLVRQNGALSFHDWTFPVFAIHKS